METKPADGSEVQQTLAEHYHRIRQDSMLLCEPLETEDFCIQTMPEVSPPKWHLAHTSWFFETLLLKPFAKNYKEFHPKFAVLFNSYYDTIGEYHPRHQRGLLSRPSINEVYKYRHHVDKAMHELLLNSHHRDSKTITSRTILGLNHEQQHQELLLTDIKHIFASNPLRPAYKKASAAPQDQHNADTLNTQWIKIDGGLKIIGSSLNYGTDNITSKTDFAYDNEGPLHQVYVEDFMLASHPVNNAEYLEFIHDDGYKKPDYWLADAWKIINQQNWQAPLYWEKIDNLWHNMTLQGMQPVDMDAPVCHVSFYEAAAFARWKDLQQTGIRLPTEMEWEVATENLTIEGNFRDSDLLQPASVTAKDNNTLQQMFGDVWEWTQSAYAAYPGYHARPGALGEYNGKFMSSQLVLRGGSCATPLEHIRKTYRNFFYPHERWQYSGFRLAKDIT